MIFGLAQISEYFRLNGCSQVRQRIAKSIAVLLTSGSTESSIKRSYGHSR